jgi:hypothetical protein
MSANVTEEERKRLTPESGFNLCGIDFFEPFGQRLYLIDHFEKYQDALGAKKERDNQDDYLILYPGA